MNSDNIALLLRSGWTQNVENPNCFYGNGRALYFYPEESGVRYWPDVRTQSNYYDRALPIADADLLALIAIE